MDAVVAGRIDGCAGDAAHFEDLAAVRDVIDQPLRPELAEAFLVDVHVDRVFGVENVVERDEDDAGFLGPLDDGAEGGRVLRVDDDRVEAGIDEVVDGRDLGRHVFAGGDDLELLQLRSDVRLRGVGLRGLDHLDAPSVSDVAVCERDTIRARLCRPLEELRVRCPRRKTVRLGGRPGNHRGTGGKRSLRHAARERERSSTLQPIVQCNHKNFLPFT